MRNRAVTKLTALLLLIIVILSILFLQQYKEDIFQEIKDQRTTLQEFTSSNPILTYILFFTATILLVNTPIPFAAMVKVIGGAIFGVIYGTLLNIIATTLGAIIGFFLGKYIIKQETYEKYAKKIKKIDKEFHHNSFLYIILLRTSLIIPFFIINFISGSTRKISFKNYTISTILGVAPLSYVYAYAGFQLATISSFNELLSPQTIFVLIVLIIVLGGTIVIKNSFEKNKITSS